MMSAGGSALSAGDFAMALIAGGIGFVLADGLDRFLATYNPSGTTAPPTSKFTSSGAGTLANTLNVASRPSLLRIGAGVGAVALPGVASMFVKGPAVKSSLEGVTIGAGISLFKTLWNNLLMPMLSPKDTTAPSLQKNFIVRLYPAEVAAHINMAQTPAGSAPSSTGALSGPPQADVGPFALSGFNDYPDVAQALRNQAGVQDQQFPTLQNTWGTGGPGSDYPTAAQALRAKTGMTGDWAPGPPAGSGPGPKAVPHSDPSCGCIGDGDQYASFLGDAPKEEPLFDTGNSPS